MLRSRWSGKVGRRVIELFTILSMRKYPKGTEALFLLGRDLDAIRAELDHAWPHWRQLDEVRADVVLSMAFNLGVAGFMHRRHELVRASVGND